MKIEVDIETLEDVLLTARKSAYGSEWDSIYALSDLIYKAKESRRPSNLDNLFRGPGYFSGETVDNKMRDKPHTFSTGKDSTGRMQPLP